MIGASLGRFVGRPGAAVLGIGAVCMLAWLAVLAGVVLAGASVIFGTVHPHAIVDTGCFVRHDDPAAPNGATWTVINGCEVFRIHPHPATVVLTLLAAALVLALVGSLLYLIVGRAVDRRFGSRRPWPLMPSAGSVVRVVMRVIGWTIVLYVAFVLAIAAVVIAFVVLAKVGSVVGVLIGVAACTYLIIWWVVPLGVRVELAFVRMVIDDRGLVDCWKQVRPSMGQAWAFVGLTSAVSLGLSVMGNVAGAAGKFGLVLVAPLQLISYTVQLVLLIAVMRFIAGELAGDSEETAAAAAP